MPGLAIHIARGLTLPGFFVRIYCMGLVLSITTIVLSFGLMWFLPWNDDRKKRKK